MDAQQFLAEFGHIASAPGGTLRLREMILAMAINGDLVQSKVTESPLVLLNAAKEELSEYKQKYKYRRIGHREETPAENRISDQAGKLPPHWLPVRLGQIGVLIRGVSYNKSVVLSAPKDGYIGLLRGNNIGIEINFDALVYVPSDLVTEEQLLRASDMLIAMSSGSKDLVGKAAQLSRDSHFAFGAFCGVFRCMPSLNAKFIRVLMQSPIYRTHVAEQGKGIGINNLTKAHIEDFCFFLPPEEEQARIVAKVDELMALCDKLEAQQQEREELRKRCCTEIIKSLALSSNTHELRKAWNSTQVFLSYPFKNKEEIASLRTAIMKLATRGILTSQYTHERGLDFINELAELRTKKSTNRSRKFNEDPVEEREIPHLIPENWVWARLGAVAEISSGSTPLKSRDDYHLSGTIPWITSTLTGRLYIDSADFFITEKAVKECNLSIYPAGTLIMAMYGQGKTRGQVTELRIKATTNQACAAIVLLDKSETFRRYVRIVLEERYHDIREFADGGPQPNLNGIKVKATVIPIPPKEEQERIVAMVSALTSLCDDLESKLHKSTNLAKNLATAAISSITGIRTEEEEELKSPKNELISKLRLGNNPDIKEQAPLAAILARHHDEMPASDLWQRYGGDIDVFYAQLKLEVGKGWIEEPAIAEMRETETLR